MSETGRVRTAVLARWRVQLQKSCAWRSNLPADFVILRRRRWVRARNAFLEPVAGGM